MQHHFYKDEELIKKAYHEFDHLVEKLNKMAKPDLFLIISDHGQKNGLHTNYGFYSSNKKLGLVRPHITDFYDIIMNWLKLPTKSEEKKVMRHLKDLDYF